MNQYIEGPTILVEMYSQKFDVIIYLFGENHGLHTCKNKNTPVSNFLVDWISKSENVIDLFLEISEFETRPIRGSMSNIIHDLQGYSNPNLRIHKHDIRHYSIFQEYYNLIAQLTSFKEKVNKPLAKLIFDYYIDVMRQTLEKWSYLFPLTFDVIAKVGILYQIEKIQDVRIRQILLDELSYHIDRINSSWENIKNLFQNKISFDLFKSQYLPKFIQEYSKIYPSYAYMVDFYLISKILSEPEIKNVIVYSGNSHTHFIVKLLEKLGFVTQNIVGNNNKDVSCINISSFLPLAF